MSIQKLVTANTLWEVAYRGSKSTRLQTNLDYNEITPNPPQPPDFGLIFPYPTLAAVGILESRAAANYHAFTTRLERRYSKGMTFLVNYTFSKTLTDVDSSTVGVANGAGAFGAQAERQQGERMSTRWEHCVENGFTGLALNHHSRGQLTTPFFPSPADSRTRLLE